MWFRSCFALCLPLLLTTMGCSSEPGDGGGGDDNLAAGGNDATNGNTGGSLGSGGGDPSGSGGSNPGGGGQDSGSGGSDPGSGGQDPGSGGSGPGEDAVPSAGCGKGGRPSGGIVYEDGSSPRGPSWLIFPEKYDGNTPLPVLFGFHGCGGGGDESGTPYLDITRNSKFETDYIVAAPVASVSNCYDYGIDMPKAKALYTELVENYCVDTSRVFATGHSYGAGGMVMALTAAGNAADFAHFNFKAIVPVAGWLIGSQSTVVPTMYIQGITDAERQHGDGKDAVDKIAQVNQCATGPGASAPTAPYLATPYSVGACNSSHDGNPVTAGCRVYEDCSVPTIWCRHDDSAYSGTFHGIPCFYQQAMYDFFESL